MKVIDLLNMIANNKEDNKIEKIEYRFDLDNDAYIPTDKRNVFIDDADVIMIDKINEIIDYLKKG